MFRVWTWPITKSYNGFSGVERVRGWQVTWWLVRRGYLKKPHCWLCGSKNRVGFHNENYYCPHQAIAICQHCHGHVHRRFKQPDEFTNYFGHLSPDTNHVVREVLGYSVEQEENLGQFMLDEYGPEVADFTLSVTEALPDLEQYLPTLQFPVQVLSREEREALLNH